MTIKKGGIRGNNRLVNRLNKPIGGKLSNKVSPKLVFIILFCLFIVFLTFAISELGFKEGLYFSVGFSFFGVFIYWDNIRQIEDREQSIKKQNSKKPFKESEKKGLFDK